MIRAKCITPCQWLKRYWAVGDIYEGAIPEEGLPPFFWLLSDDGDSGNGSGSGSGTGGGGKDGCCDVCNAGVASPLEMTEMLNEVLGT